MLFVLYLAKSLVTQLAPLVVSSGNIQGSNPPSLIVVIIESSIFFFLLNYLINHISLEIASMFCLLLHTFS